MKSSIKLAALSAAILSAPMSSLAATDTDSFLVEITLTATCTIDSAADMDFGTNSADITANIDATSDIVVTCTNNAPYTLALDDGSNFTTNRRMASGGGSFVDYELYSDSGRTTRFGSSAAEDVDDTGTGSAQTHTVYGRVPVQTPVIAEAIDTGLAFSDTINVTLTY